MKKLARLVFFASFFLFITVTGLFAQISPDSRIFVLPVTGEGSGGVKTYFYDRVIYEIAFQDHLLSWERRTSDYVIRSVIYPVVEANQPVSPPASGAQQRSNPGERREFLSWELNDPVYFYDTSGAGSSRDKPGFVIVLTLMLSRTNEVIDTKQLVFNEINEKVNEGISVIISEFIRGRPVRDPAIYDAEYIPPVIVFRNYETQAEDEEDPVYSENWRDRFLFFEIGALWMPRYNYLNEEIVYVNFGASIIAELQFLNFLSLETGVQFAMEPSGGEENFDVVVEIPVALKIVFKPGSNIMLGFFGGVSFNPPITFINKIVVPSVFSYFGGIEFCVGMGPGALFFEPRFGMDINDSMLGSSITEKRWMGQFGVGYKLGLARKLVTR